MTASERTAQSLGNRLSRWFALLSLSALVAASLLVYCVLTWTLSSRQAAELVHKRDAVEQVLRELIQSGDSTEFAHRFDGFLAGHVNLGLQIVDENGFETYARAPRSRAGELKTLEFNVPRHTDRGGSLRAKLTLDTQSDDRVLRVVAMALVAISSAGALIVSAAGYKLVNSGLAPVRALSRQVEAIEMNRRGMHLDGGGQPGELLPLVGSFNRLLTRAETAYEQQEAFNADVAHELRTPLTSLISASEVALSRARRAQELSDVIEHNLEDLRRLSGIVDDMLFLSQADRGARARRTQVDSVSALLAAMIDFHDAAFQEATISSQLVGDASASLDVNLIRRAASNLLSNARRFAHPSSSVLVTVSMPTASRLRVAVRNMGTPIDPSLLPRIFNRFVRGDRSLAAVEPHFGLGLAIVAAIARMHGGHTFAYSDNSATTVGLEVDAGMPATSVRTAARPSGDGSEHIEPSAGATAQKMAASRTR